MCVSGRADANNCLEKLNGHQPKVMDNGQGRQWSGQEDYQLPIPRHKIERVPLESNETALTSPKEHLYDHTGNQRMIVGLEWTKMIYNPDITTSCGWGPWEAADCTKWSEHRHVSIERNEGGQHQWRQIAIQDGINGSNREDQSACPLAQGYQTWADFSIQTFSIQLSGIDLVGCQPNQGRLNHPEAQRWNQPAM